MTEEEQIPQQVMEAEDVVLIDHPSTSQEASSNVMTEEIEPSNRDTENESDIMVKWQRAIKSAAEAQKLLQEVMDHLAEEIGKNKGKGKIHKKDKKDKYGKCKKKDKQRMAQEVLSECIEINSDSDSGTSSSSNSSTCSDIEYKGKGKHHHHRRRHDGGRHRSRTRGRDRSQSRDRSRGRSRGHSRGYSRGRSRGHSRGFSATRDETQRHQCHSQIPHSHDRHHHSHGFHNHRHGHHHHHHIHGPHHHSHYPHLLQHNFEGNSPCCRRLERGPSTRSLEDTLPLALTL